MTTKIRELKAIHCGQKSFYKKAFVIEHYDDTQQETKLIQLQSYDTIVVKATASKSGHTVIIDDMWSNTTKRHIKDFIIQYFGLNAWAQIEKEFKKGITQWDF